MVPICDYTFPKAIQKTKGIPLYSRMRGMAGVLWVDSLFTFRRLYKSPVELCSGQSAQQLVMNFGCHRNPSATHWPPTNTHTTHLFGGFFYGWVNALDSIAISLAPLDKYFHGQPDCFPLFRHCR